MIEVTPKISQRLVVDDIEEFSKSQNVLVTTFDSIFRLQTSVE